MATIPFVASRAHFRDRALAATRRHAWAAWIVLAVPGLWAYFFVPGVDRDLQYELFGMLAVVGMLAGTVLHAASTRDRWRIAAVGLGFYVLGDALYTVLEQSGPVPVPSIADAAYLGGFLIFALAVTRLAEPDDRGLLRPTILDAALVATCAGILAWHWILDPLTTSATDIVGATVAMAYPVLDLLLIFVLLRHLLANSRKSASLWLLSGGVILFLAADLAFTSMSLEGTYETGTLVDAGWLVGYVLFAAAALHPTMARLAVAEAVVDPISNRRIALLVVVVSIGAAGIVLGPRETETDLLSAVIATLMLAGLGLMRLVGSLVETRSLLTEARDLRDRMVDQARTDALTGMPNRAAFNEAMRRALSGEGDLVGILYLDLDQFKAVNDTWGHSSGDELLVAVAARLREAVRESDVVARLGGDEFGVLVARTPTSDGPAELAEKILGLFEAPFALSETSVSIHPSIGIVVGQTGDDEVHLLRQADIAMYDAKRQGGRRWQRFTDTHELVADRYRLANELEHAIDAGELVLHYQPIVDLDTGAIVAAEALVRWAHPERGLLQPGAFIPVAESSGLIGRLDRWVLRAALSQVRAWLNAGIWTEDQRIHVNVAPGDLEDPEIVEIVEAALRVTGAPAGVLALEVTESALLEVDGTRRHIEEIARLGVRLSLDDFGTRYAVLATLADLPFTTLKIDRAFVLALENPSRARLFEGIVRLAERLGLDPLAEGIETDEQRALVRQHGCRLAQGFLLGRPVPAADFAVLLGPAGSPGLSLLAAAI